MTETFKSVAEGEGQPLVDPDKSAEAGAGTAVDLGVALLTAGRDKPYAIGLGTALAGEGVEVDFIGSDFVDDPSLHELPQIKFFNLRGDQAETASLFQKIFRVLIYYLRLLSYAVRSKHKVFHILWHNKFEFLDRTLVMGFYKLLGKRIAFTAHNVNIGKRDGRDTWVNRTGLRSEYRLADRIFVHTELMKRELMDEFQVPEKKVVVIPFGINNTLPNTELTHAQAREQLGLGQDDKVLLFFGNIAAYKGLELLVDAFLKLAKQDESYRLVIAGRPKGAESYWGEINKTIESSGLADRTVRRVEFVPDEDVEIFFKAADLLVLPYRLIFQSGVLFLGYSFGLPVLAADVGSLAEGIEEGRTGYVCRPEDADDLKAKIERYFSSPLFGELPTRRADIIQFANEEYSWSKVARITREVYVDLAEG